MTEIIDIGIVISMLISGLYLTLIGFGVINLKTWKAEDAEKIVIWHQKFGKFFKIGGLIVLIIGVFQLITPDSVTEIQNWTQSQKDEMKAQVMNSSHFHDSINSDTAVLIVTCFVDKYTEKFTLQESCEQDKMTQEQKTELTMPIMNECFEVYGVEIIK